MEVDESSAVAEAEYRGDRYYFCSQQCKETFVADPEKFVSRTEHSQT